MKDKTRLTVKFSTNVRRASAIMTIAFLAELVIIADGDYVLIIALLIKESSRA